MPNTTKKAVKRKSKGTSRKGGESCPIFLQKTYLMIDTCNPSIACWSIDTSISSFIVKHPDQFASSVIPQYFKHSNFASFVRQLNFYGFRKIKSDPIKLSDSSEQKNYWYFQHDLFREGRKDLLNQIRKANQGSVVPVQDQEDVTSLKHDVTSLQKQLNEMSVEMEKVTALVQKVNSSSSRTTTSSSESSFTPHESTTDACHTNAVNSTPIQIDENASDLLDFTNISDLDLLLDPGMAPATTNEFLEEEHNEILAPLPNDESRDSNSSFLSREGPSDMELDDSLLFTDLEHDTVALSTPSKTPIGNDTTVSAPSALLVNDDSSTSGSSTDETPSGIDFRQPLYDCLAVLPTNVQEQVVDGLTTTITNPDFFHDHINLVSSLAKILTDVLHTEKEGDMKKATSNVVGLTHPVTLESGRTNEAPATTNSVSLSADTEKKNSDLALSLVSTLMAAIITQPNSLSCHNPTSNANPTSLPIQV